MSHPFPPFLVLCLHEQIDVILILCAINPKWIDVYQVANAYCSVFRALEDYFIHKELDFL